MITTDSTFAIKLSNSLLEAQEQATKSGLKQYILHVEELDDFIVLDSELTPENDAWPTAIIVEPD